jgi:hypothetical protein
MALQMYIVTFRGGFNQESSRNVQQHFRKLGGYVLMVTPNGPIVAIDDSQAGAAGKHPAIAFMGGVSFNPKGKAAEALQRIFAENLSKQIEVVAANGSSEKV